jgi:pimeloyl-ACP methyl ester carboxylesterase
LLDSVSVPVAQPLSLSVVIGSPAPPGGVSFQLSSDDPAIVAAGDPHQGFLPIVTIPEGQTGSNQFTIFGISVGQTRLRLTPLSPGFLTSVFPLGAWDVNTSGSGLDKKFLDANDPDQPCRDAGASSLTSNAALQSTCGNTVKGVASDGVNALLLRTLSGLAGTACFEIVSSSPLDQGTIQTPLTATQSVSPLNYGFSYYTPPSSYDDTSLSRTINVEFTFTPNIGNGNTSTLQAQTQIVRPPVMLIHGVWSDGGGWSSDYLRNDAVHTTYAGDYKSSNASSFSTNEPKIQGFVAQALKTFRQKGYAATQSDVIAHSMGGLLTRLYAGSQTYQRPDNLNKGDVHRLVTLDTPHFGSNFANLLVALHRATPAKTEAAVSALTGGTVVNGAVCDLAENSPALQTLAGGTALRSQVITATGGPAGTAANPALYWGGATIFGIRSFESALTEQYCTNWVVDPSGQAPPVCTSHAFYFPQPTVDAFRFREMNDAVVPLSSEQGGLGGFNFGEFIHFHIPGIPGVQRGITDGQNVSTQVFQILDGPDSGLVSALPAVQSNGSGGPKTVPGRGTPLDQQDYANQCGPGGVLKLNSFAPLPVAQGVPSRQSRPAIKTVSTSVNVVSPAAGTIFTQGDVLTIVVALSPPLTAGNTVGATLANLQHVTATWTTGLRFTATFVIPPLVTGPLTITPDYTDTQGNFVTGAPVTVGVKTAALPVSVAFQQRNFFLAPGQSAQQLYLNGAFADSTVLDLTSGFTGTAYSSSNPAVVTVSADGLVQIAGAGFGVITGKNGTATDAVTFVIEDPANPLPPANITAQFTIVKSGFRLDRTSGFYVQDISVTNSSGTPIPAAVQLVFSGVTSGVTLVNKSGLTAAITPIGSSFVTLNLPGDGLTLPAGFSNTFTAHFLNPSRSAINYTLNVFRTSKAP